MCCDKEFLKLGMGKYQDFVGISIDNFHLQDSPTIIHSSEMATNLDVYLLPKVVVSLYLMKIIISHIDQEL
jgi:hypothetical protein